VPAHEVPAHEVPAHEVPAHEVPAHEGLLMKCLPRRAYPWDACQ
jgi:hypothetical protein